MHEHRKTQQHTCTPHCGHRCMHRICISRDEQHNWAFSISLSGHKLFIKQLTGTNVPERNPSGWSLNDREKKLLLDRWASYTTPWRSFLKENIKLKLKPFYLEYIFTIFYLLLSTFMSLRFEVCTFFQTHTTGVIESRTEILTKRGFARAGECCGCPLYETWFCLKIICLHVIKVSTQT